jgi:hypothetical protein
LVAPSLSYVKAFVKFSGREGSPWKRVIRAPLGKAPLRTSFLTWVNVGQTCSAYADTNMIAKAGQNAERKSKKDIT